MWALRHIRRKVPKESDQEESYEQKYKNQSLLAFEAIIGSKSINNKGKQGSE